jgi:hypothetical protein
MRLRSKSTYSRGHIEDHKNRAARFFAVIIVAVSLSACEKTYERYINYNKPTQAQFSKDRAECYQEVQAKSSGVPTCVAFNACLSGRGYIRADTTSRDDFNALGSLSVPDDSAAKCQK